MAFDFRPHTREESLALAEEVITGQLGKDPVLRATLPSRSFCGRKILRGKDRDIQVAKLCDTSEETDRFEGGAT